MIDVIFSDIDGCLVPEGYDPLGSIHDERKHVFRAWEHHYRTIKPGALVHGSVSQRAQEKTKEYAPANLPDEVGFV